MPRNNLSELHREVARFLLDYHNCLDTSNRLIKPRKINEKTIKKLGFTYRQIKEVLYSLTIDDYYAGPKKDDYHGGHFWEFGKEVDDTMLYIKIKIHTLPDGTDIPFCYSFHEPEFPMTHFPLAGVE